jgi:hypothetical protein
VARLNALMLVSSSGSLEWIDAGFNLWLALRL